jgi:hypothetical protein
LLWGKKRREERQKRSDETASPIDRPSVGNVTGNGGGPSEGKTRPSSLWVYLLCLFPLGGEGEDCGQGGGAEREGVLFWSCAQALVR